MPPPILVVPVAAFIAARGTRFTLPWLKQHMMDVPNARSNHKTPVPRGGGIAMIAVSLMGGGLYGMPPAVLAAGLLLAAVSFMDDLSGLSVGLRLVAQLAVVAGAIYFLPGRIFPAVVPLPVEWGIIGFIWLWFINLTNFMDGIDGISAMQAIMISCGIVFLYFVSPALPATIAAQAGVMAAAAYGFYLFNRTPARAFMGDVGSIPLGFLLGYLLLCLAAYGYPLPALTLPAYYLCDATQTLVKRLLKAKNIWQAHSEHAYQQAVRLGLTHTQVVDRITLLNVMLIGLASLSVLSMIAGVIATIAAYGLTFALIHYFNHGTPKSA